MLGEEQVVTKRISISEIMTTQVQTVQVQDRMSEVRKKLAKGRFHHAPVIDGDALVGMISSRDLVRIYRELAATDQEVVDELLDRSTTIEQTMSTDLVTMRFDEDFEKAIDLLADGDIHSVLVLNEEKELVGIVTNVDLLDFLFD
jgi:CBS domain-containing protein